MNAPEHEDEYTDDFIARLQFKWGDGFLSPGGADEVAEMLQGVSIEGSYVLDVGCGLGAIDELLVRDHGARKVLGIDVERPLIEKAISRSHTKGYDQVVEFELVKAGPLSYDENSFDIVFSKDALIHIPNKADFYTEIFRVLVPGGTFVASDWYKANGPCPALAQFLSDGLGLSVKLQTLEEAGTQLEQVGFQGVHLRDRHEWFRAVAEKELRDLKETRRQEFIGMVGEEAARSGIEMNELMVDILHSGELRPGHIVADRPH